jgi:hypothetical protein
VPVVLYATLGTKDAAVWHSAVLAALQSPGVEVQYIFRHAVPGGAGAVPLRVPLLGFGVGLDIKNMEYKALDDRAPGVRAVVVVVQQQGGGGVGGVGCMGCVRGLRGALFITSRPCGVNRVMTVVMTMRTTTKRVT